MPVFCAVYKTGKYNEREKTGRSVEIGIFRIRTMEFVCMEESGLNKRQRNESMRIVKIIDERMTGD